MINSLEIKDRISNRQRSDFQLWKPVTVDEIWVYVAVIMMMGIINKSNYKMFWTKDNIFSTAIFARLMRRDRFEQIHMMLHFLNIIEEDPDDNLRKLSFFLDELLKIFKGSTPQNKTWKGRLKFRVYIPSKRERYGVKISM